MREAENAVADAVAEQLRAKHRAFAAARDLERLAAATSSAGASAPAHAAPLNVTPAPSAIAIASATAAFNDAGATSRSQSQQQLEGSSNSGLLPPAAASSVSASLQASASASASSEHVSIPTPTPIPASIGGSSPSPTPSASAAAGGAGGSQGTPCVSEPVLSPTSTPTPTPSPQPSSGNLSQAQVQAQAQTQAQAQQVGSNSALHRLRSSGDRASLAREQSQLVRRVVDEYVAACERTEDERTDWEFTLHEVLGLGVEQSRTRTHSTHHSSTSISFRLNLCFHLETVSRVPAHRERSLLQRLCIVSRREATQYDLTSSLRCATRLNYITR